MTSIVWGRHPQEAYDNPYEYEAQAQFLREAKALLNDLNLQLDTYTLHYHRDERTLKKATWMLSLDLVDGLLECALLLEEKRHRPAARLFRDAVETIDLLKLLHSPTPRAVEVLNQWYENITVPHRVYREYLEEIAGDEAAKARKAYFDELSKFTHRTYRALSDSYSLGRDNLLVHDSHSKQLIVLPQTIAAYLAVLSDLIVQATDCLAQTGVLSEEAIATSRSQALETHTVPRRFAIRSQNGN